VTDLHEHQQALLSVPWARRRLLRAHRPL